MGQGGNPLLELSTRSPQMGMSVPALVGKVPFDVPTGSGLCLDEDFDLVRWRRAPIKT